MKIKYKDLFDNRLTIALIRLAQATLPVKSAYNVKKLGDALSSAKKAAQEKYRAEVVAQYAEKNAEGKIDEVPPSETTPEGFKVIEGQMEAYRAAQDAFAENEVEITRNPLLLDDIAGAQLSATDMIALDPFVVEFRNPEGATDNVTSIGSVHA